MENHSIEFPEVRRFCRTPDCSVQMKPLEFKNE